MGEILGLQSASVKPSPVLADGPGKVIRPMFALDRALAQLDQTTGFARDFDDIVVTRGGFPDRWMTAEHLNHELTKRGFWDEKRSDVHGVDRVRLIERFLDQRVEHPDDDPEHAWKRFDGQYKRNPQTQLIDDRAPHEELREVRRVDVKDMRCQYGPVVNLSSRGLLFCTVDKPKMKVGDRGFLRLKHADTRLKVFVKVHWMKPSPHGTQVGADFRRLSPMAQQTIARLLIDAADEDA